MDVLQELNRLKVETGSLACLGCGHEHGCDVHGCAILREAEAEITRLRLGNAVSPVCYDCSSVPEIAELIRMLRMGTISAAHAKLAANVLEFFLFSISKEFTRKLDDVIVNGKEP